MLVLPDRKLIFIHVPKTAGSSIRAALNQWAPSEVRGIFNWHVRAVEGARILVGWETYFSFAFVRNPWAAQLSMYNYILRYGPAHPEWEAVAQFPSVNVYLARYIAPRWEMGKVPSQSDFVVGAGGEQIVTFVGRFEQLDHDFAGVCDRVGLPRSALPAVNASAGDSYRDGFDADGRDIVARIFRDDVERFGYKF